MAPMFITSALVSGLALVILLALVAAAPRAGSDFGDDLVAFLGGLLGVFIAVEAFLVLAEYLTASYPGAAEASAIERMLVGPYAPLFWFEIGVGLLRALRHPRHRRLRADPAWLGRAGARASRSSASSSTAST